MSVPTMFTMPRNILFSFGLPAAENTNYQLGPDQLRQQCIDNEGTLNDARTLVTKTNNLASSGPENRFIVKDKITENTVDWNEINQPIEEKYFDGLYVKMMDHFKKKEIWIRDFYPGADTEYKLNIRIISEDPSSNLFVYDVFPRPSEKELENFDPDWYIIHAPSFLPDPPVKGTRQKSFTMISFTKKVILIGGSANNDEIKKGVVFIINFLLHH